MPSALSKGMPEEIFWNSTYRKMKAYSKAYDIRMEQQDLMNWMFGQYIMSSIEATIGNMFRKKEEPIINYLDKPLFASVLEEQERIENDPEANERLAVEEMKARIRMIQEQMGVYGDI